MRPFLRLAIAAAMLVAGGPALAFDYANPTKPYYSEAVMKQGDRSVPVKTWYSADKVKMEVSNGGRQLVLIADRMAKTLTLILPGRKGYFIRPMPQDTFGPLGKTGPGKGMAFEKVGEEAVNGTKAVKYKVSGKNAGGSAFDGHLWITADNIIVRLDGRQTAAGKEQAIRVDVKVLKMGPHDAKVFTVPEGYRKMG